MAILTQTLNQNKGTTRALLVIGGVIAAIVAFFDLLVNLK